ncbi:MAG TPA: hypothetical protein DEP84_14060 [Chloroflexi bacterium]|nr:hypothetical protein [Chloroflexota bacterium]
MLSEPIAVTLLVTGALEGLGVPYAIGGSLASAVYGVARATQDADIVADLRLDHVERFARVLGEAFYVDTEMIREAVQQRSSFNVIHWDTQFKVDIFIPKRRAFDQAQLARRTAEIVATEPERTAYLASPEDNLLSKLEWYQMTERGSERQWRDVLGIIKTQGDRLDLDYLRRMASTLEVSDLFEQALVAAQE